MEKHKLRIPTFFRGIGNSFQSLKITHGNFVKDVGLFGLLVITMSFIIWFGLILKLIFTYVL